MVAILLLWLAFDGGRAEAIVRTWDGGGGANTAFGNSVNWDPNGVPVAGDDAVFNLARIVVDILDWGALAGTFDSIMLPELADDLEWNTTQLYTDGTLSVAAPGLQGDYNNDGAVDAADYVVWRNNPDGFGGDPAGYDTWRVNFGATSGGSSAANAVPEPTSAALMLVALASLFLATRGAAKNNR